MTKLIGITGGIGSGKTTVAKMFEAAGIPVFIADDEAKIAATLEHVQEKIIVAFGADILTDKIIDRKKLAAIVFNNSSKLQALNNIIHPEVYKRFKSWCDAHKNEAILMYESAILLETSNPLSFYKIITVSAPEDLRINRVQARNGLSVEQIKSIILNQWTDYQREKEADYIVSNINIQDTKLQVQSLIKQLKLDGFNIC